MYFLYSLMLSAALLLSSPYWLFQMLRTGKYREGVGERFGRVPPRILPPGEMRRSIWVHAVSVGEVLAVGSLIPELQKRFPSHRVVVSTTTATGQKLAHQRFGTENVFYFPLDFTFAIKPYLRALRPELVVMAETEFWPNFLRLAYTAGARVAVVNARISDHSLPRYRRWRGVMSRVLANVNVFLAQSEEDRRRLVEIGAAPEHVQVSGNLKFDVKSAGAPAIVGGLRAALRAADAGPIVVCGSTVEGEELLLLPAFRAVLERWPKSVIILAPRHPERFDEVARLLADSGLRFWRRSQWQGEAISSGIFLLDSIGELAAMYSLASVAFIGGSLVPRGGHNVLEPAQAGAAILVGPFTENFRDIVARFREAGALWVVAPENTTEALLELINNEAERAAMTRRAADALCAHAGATERTVRALEALLATNAQEVVRR